MGYTTDFMGSVSVQPPLNEHEISFLEEFSGTRRMHRKQGPYFAKDDGHSGQGTLGAPGPDILNYNGSDPEQPGLWCQWVPTADGANIEWDGNEKFYNAPEWMKYIVGHFFVNRAVLQQRLDTDWFEQHGYPVDSRFKHFTFDHVLNGEIEAQGEDPGDHWKLVVEDSVVKTASTDVTW